MIRKFNVSYFAASVDEAEENKKFAASLELDYPILSDPDKDVARAYGVITGPQQWASRHTIYIGLEGKVIHIDKKIRVGVAGEDIAARLEELGVDKR